MRTIFFVFLIFNFCNSYSQVIKDTSFYFTNYISYYKIEKYKVNLKLIKNGNFNLYEINLNDKKYLTLELPNSGEIEFKKLFNYTSQTYRFYSLSVPNKTWERGNFKFYDTLGKLKLEGKILNYFKDDSIATKETIYIDDENKCIGYRTTYSQINYKFYQNYVFFYDTFKQFNKNQIQLNFYKNGITFTSEYYENGKLKTLNEDYFVSEWDNFNKISELATSQFHKTIYFKKDYKYLNGNKYYSCIKNHDTLTQLFFSIDGKIKYFYNSIISKNSKVSPVYLDPDYCCIDEPLSIATYSNLLPLEFIKYDVKSGKEEYHSISSCSKNNKVEYKASFVFKDSIYEFQSKFYIYKNKKNNEWKIDFDKSNEFVWNLNPNNKYFEFITLEECGNEIINNNYPISINSAASLEYVEIIPFYHIISEVLLYNIYKNE